MRVVEAIKKLNSVGLYAKIRSDSDSHMIVGAEHLSGGGEGDGVESITVLEGYFHISKVGSRYEGIIVGTGRGDAWRYERKGSLEEIVNWIIEHKQKRFSAAGLFGKPINSSDETVT